MSSYDQGHLVDGSAAVVYPERPNRSKLNLPAPTPVNKETFPDLFSDYSFMLSDKGKNQYLYSEVLRSYLSDQPERENILDSIETCSDFVHVRQRPDGSRLYGFQRCHSKLCPICLKMRALRDKRYLDSILSMIGRSYYFCHIVLTCVNPDFDHFYDVCQKMVYAYSKFVANFLRNTLHCAGTWGSFECTYNFEADTYHPHFHILVAFPRSYSKLKHDDPGYLSQERLKVMWQKYYDYSASIVYISHVDVTKKAFHSNEFVKYAAKPFNKNQAALINQSDECKKKFYLGVIRSIDMMSGFSQRKCSGIFRSLLKYVKNKQKAEWDKYSFCEIGLMVWDPFKSSYTFYPSPLPYFDRTYLDIYHLKRKLFIKQMRC